MTHQFTYLYIIYIKTSSRIQELSKYIKYIKSYIQNNLYFCLTSFLFVIHLNLKQLGFSGQPMTQYTSESHANVNHMRMQKNPLPCHAMSNHIKTQNANPKNCDVNTKKRM